MRGAALEITEILLLLNMGRRSMAFVVAMTSEQPALHSILARKEAPTKKPNGFVLRKGYVFVKEMKC